MAYEAGQSDASVLEDLTHSKTMKALVKKRSLKGTGIGKTINNIYVGHCLTMLEIKKFIQKLSELLSNIVKMDNKIEKRMLENHLWSDGEHTRQADFSETYFDSIQQNMLMFQSMPNSLSMPAVHELTIVNSN